MTTNSSQTEDNLFTFLMYKYIPFWPLFAALLVAFLVGAYGYLHYFAIPTYDITATLIIKDEKKGVNDSRMTESIDVFTSNNIVENEIKVIQSRALLKQVVEELSLYAPIYEEAQFKSNPAYATSPITIVAKEPATIKGVEKVYFTFDDKQNKVQIDYNNYALDKWVKTPYGELKFIRNKHQLSQPTEPLYFSLVNPRIVTDQLFSSLNIQAENKISTVVNLKLQDPVPVRGENILNTLIHTYNQVALDERNKLALNTLEFVEDRIKLVEKDLADIEAQVVKFKSSQGAVDLGEQGRMYLKSVSENDRKITDINLQLAVLDKVERYVISKQNAAGIVPSTLGVNDPVLSQLLQKLYDSEIEYQKLSQTTAENNPVLISLNEEIRKIRPSILENIKSQRNNLRAGLANLANTNSQYNSSLQSIPQKERELMEISRQQAIKNNAYSFLLQKREETVLSYAPTAGDSRVVDMAESTMLPVSPKPLYFYLVAAVLSFVFGVAVITGKELLNSTILFRSEIEEHTNAPIVAELAAVKQVPGERFKQPTEASVIEQFRQLRTTMGLYGRTFTKKKIIVTSSIPGEGKSFVSSNLALSLASSGKKVVLLDFDLRNPNTSQQFGLYKQSGIIEYMTGEAIPEEITRTTEFTNLSVVPAGISIGDHTELLLNGRLDNLFDYYEREFDYLILDTPPVDLVSDAYLLSEYCDITLLVMRHAHTPKRLVKRLSQDNKLKSLNKVAIVFNGVKPRGFVKGQYGYGYGYGYENKYGDKTYRNRTAIPQA